MRVTKPLLLTLAPIAVLAVSLAACVSQLPNSSDISGLRAEVLATERAFAKTMADRDFKAFQSFLAPEAVFYDGKQPLTGPAAIAASWKPLYEGAQAPFSWQPELVTVLTTGDLALSTGPVRDPQGKVIAQFNSIWRRVGRSKWQVVFDKGCRACACSTP